MEKERLSGEGTAGSKPSPTTCPSNSAVVGPLPTAPKPAAPSGNEVSEKTVVSDSKAITTSSEKAVTCDKPDNLENVGGGEKPPHAKKVDETNNGVECAPTTPEHAVRRSRHSPPPQPLPTAPAQEETCDTPAQVQEPDRCPKWGGPWAGDNSSARAVAAPLRTREVASTELGENGGGESGLPTQNDDENEVTRLFNNHCALGRVLLQVVCSHAGMHASMYVYTYIYIYSFLHMHMQIYSYIIGVNVNIHICKCKNTCKSKCICVYMHSGQYFC